MGVLSGVPGVPRVFWARRQQVVATLFIVVLAAVDFSTCLIVMPFTVYMELMHFHVKQDPVCKLYQAFLLFHCILLNISIHFKTFYMFYVVFVSRLCVCQLVYHNAVADGPRDADLYAGILSTTS